MKKIFSIIICIVLCFGLTNCSFQDNNDTSAYDDGYADGYTKGKQKGEENLAIQIYGRLDDACGIIYGIEEALTVLNLYADGEYIPEEELFEAIQIVDQFYDDVRDIMLDIEKY